MNMYRGNKELKTQEFLDTIQTTQRAALTTQDSCQQSTEEDKAVLRVVAHNPRLIQKEMAQELGWTIDRVKYYLNKMKKQT